MDTHTGCRISAGHLTTSMQQHAALMTALSSGCGMLRYGIVVKLITDERTGVVCEFIEWYSAVVPNLFFTTAQNRFLILPQWPEKQNVQNLQNKSNKNFTFQQFAIIYNSQAHGVFGFRIASWPKSNQPRPIWFSTTVTVNQMNAKTGELLPV